jgi:putative transcriptional regulator
MAKTLAQYEPGEVPTPAQIIEARADMSRPAAAALIYAGSFTTWRNWEHGKRAMPPGMFELFLLKTFQHPTLILTPKRKRNEQQQHEEITTRSRQARPKHAS